MNTLQFSHANGFPAKTYTYLFSRLHNTQVNFVERMGHGAYPFNGDTHNLAAELIASIQATSSQPVVGVGHSTGGMVTLLAAAKQPELFSQVIVIEPTLFASERRAAITLARQNGNDDRLGLAQAAMRRRGTFPSKASAQAHYQKKTLFQKFHPRCFDDYITYGLKPSSGEMQLAFSPEIEADIFRSTYTGKPPNLNRVKGALIYGDKSDLFSQSDARWWKKAYPYFEHIAFQGGHLLPLEQPDQTAELLNRLIAN